MKITHYQKRETKTVTVRVMAIQTKPNTLGEGMEHVVLCTDQGLFSTFMPTWKRLGIDADKLNPGALMEIEYFEKEWHGHTYKNFSKARLVGNVAAPSAAPEETVSEAELDALVRPIQACA